MASRVAGQAGGTTADSTTAVTHAFAGNVTAGNLLVMCCLKFSPSTDAFVVGDISKSAGTATVGTFTMDKDLTGGSGSRFNVAIFSVPVTVSGSCTIQVAGGPAGSFWFLAVDEIQGSDISAGRLADTSSASNTTGAPNSTDSDSTGPAIFVGAVCTDTSAPTTHTAGADFLLIAESEDGTNHVTGSSELRFVSGTTTDSADWTAPTTVAWLAVLAVYIAVDVQTAASDVEDQLAPTQRML